MPSSDTSPFPVELSTCLFISPRKSFSATFLSASEFPSNLLLSPVEAPFDTSPCPGRGRVSIANAGEGGSSAPGLRQPQTLTRSFLQTHDCTGPDGSAVCLSLTAADIESSTVARPAPYAAASVALKC